MSISQTKPKPASPASPLAKQFAAPLHLEACTEAFFFPALAARLGIGAKLIRLHLSKTRTKAIFKPLGSTMQIITRGSFLYLNHRVFQSCRILMEVGVQDLARAPSPPGGASWGCRHLVGSIVEVPAPPRGSLGLSKMSVAVGSSFLGMSCAFSCPSLSPSYEPKNWRFGKIIK